MKHIAIIGAFDRYNYGDVLMPIVFSKYAYSKTANIKFHYYGQTKKDMSYCKGIKSNPLHRIYKHKFDSIIMIGGEILGCYYTDMYLHGLHSKKACNSLRELNTASPVLTNLMCRILLRGTAPHPWIVPNKTGANIIYNTVGGNLQDGIKHLTSNEKKRVLADINNCSYISVRTQKCLAQINRTRSCQLYPDSVTCISKIISDGDIERRIHNASIKELVMDEYYVLQVNHEIGEKVLKPLVAQIKEIAKTTNLKCVLLPMGYAMGHEDQVILSKIHELCLPETYFWDFLNVFETLFILKNAKLYVGSSLHGAITAISYGIPHCAISKEAYKLVEYLSNWNSTKYIYANPYHLSDTVKQLYNDTLNLEYTKEQSEILIGLAKENLDNIIKLL